MDNIDKVYNQMIINQGFLKKLKNAATFKWTQKSRAKQLFKTTQNALKRVGFQQIEDQTSDNFTESSRYLGYKQLQDDPAGYKFIYKLIVKNQMAEDQKTVDTSIRLENAISKKAVKINKSFFKLTENDTQEQIINKIAECIKPIKLSGQPDNDQLIQNIKVKKQKIEDDKKAQADKKQQDLDAKNQKAKQEQNAKKQQDQKDQHITGLLNKYTELVKQKLSDIKQTIKAGPSNEIHKMYEYQLAKQAFNNFNQIQDSEQPKADKAKKMKSLAKDIEGWEDDFNDKVTELKNASTQAQSKNGKRK